MRRFICPSCGRRYNGRRCKNCLYENFSEEIGHGNHTHAGEPLVIRDPQRRPIPRKDPFGCDEKTRRPGIPRIAMLAMLIILLTIIIGSAYGILKDSVTGARDAFSGIAGETDPVLPTDGIPLYDSGGIRVVADWQENRKYEDGIRIVAENTTRRDIDIFSQGILVNDYLMDSSLLYCPVEAGRTAECRLILEEPDLAEAGIEDVQWISLSLTACDAESYETLAQTGYVFLCSTPVLTQEVDDRGQVLFDQDGIRLICRGYVPDSYDPETVSEGELLFLLENNTDQTVDCFTEDVFVNGQQAPLSLWCDMPPHSRAVRRMYLYGLSGEEISVRSREDVTEMTAAFIFQFQDDGFTTVHTGSLDIPFQLDWNAE